MKPRGQAFKFISILFIVLAVSSCGNETETPPDGEILINPAGRTYTTTLPVGSTIPGCPGGTFWGLFAGADTYEITLFDEFGNPLGNTDFEIAVGNGLGLYDNLGNLLLPGAAIRYPATTDPDGTYTAYVSAAAVCPFTTSLEVWSRATYTNVEIKSEYEVST